ncbi:hypothetical protein M9H77_25010 [Catharanthus roseus]|uniref:Uncharacterized protein n=1 Tax=Catharanthus roseus TaxID=4058 RepID=A0ACC0A5Q4_CATRO|nr:hypothetical protein M9H77_25010 [Catharanthus roseus]
MTISNNLIHTCYDILGVKEDASYEQIRATYRALILSSHPDKLSKDSESSTSNNETGNRFIELQKAWEILSDPKLRATYDNELRILRQDAATSEDVNLEDLTIEDSGETLMCSYSCRCGDYFAIDSLELAEMGYFLSRNQSIVRLHTTKSLPASVILPCGSCSLKICLLITSNFELCMDDHL